MRRLLLLLLAVGVVLLAIAGYWYPWTGFDAYTLPKSDTVEYIREKTLWDWMQLLVIPVGLAIVGFFLNQIEREREREISSRQRASEEIQARYEAEEAQRKAELQAETDRAAARDRAEDALVQEYLDRMERLILHEQLKASQPDADVRSVARARTLTMLSALTDGRRKGSVVQFLYEAGLITGQEPIVRMEDANLKSMYVDLLDLHGVNLGGADLTEAHLRVGDLGRASLVRANLTGADLRLAFMIKADVRYANMSMAHLEWATFTGADLTGANLKGANLRYARDLTVDQLKAAESLLGATMPDGSVVSRTPDGPTTPDARDVPTDPAPTTPS